MKFRLYNNNKIHRHWGAPWYYSRKPDSWDEGVYYWNIGLFGYHITFNNWEHPIPRWMRKKRREQKNG